MKKITPKSSSGESVMSSRPLTRCRLCAGSCKSSIAIFETAGLLNFAEKIKSYLHVEIKNSNDGDDVRMCKTCHEKIKNWDEYAAKVQKVQGMFSSTPKESTGEVKMTEEGKLTNSEERKKTRPKRRVKVRKEDLDDCHFSEEDDIPLINSAPPEDTMQKEFKTDEEKKFKPKIKLKIIKSDKSSRRSVEREAEEREEGEEEKVTKRAGLQQLYSWECLHCHESVKNWNALVKHCKETHDSYASVQCVCGKLLQSRASIMKHRMKHTIGYGYKCEFENCNKTFHRQQLLDIHSLSHMPKELQPWMCCKCSRRFHTESLLKQHEKVHLPKEEKHIHPCEVCQKKFCSKSAVSAHIRAVHLGERPFVCDQCGHSFTSKGILHEHLTIHSDVCNFPCKDCNKSFKTKYRLKIHMDTHVETRYQCPICRLTLNTRRTLRMHLLVHKDDKAFQCTTCGKAFKRSKDLKNHYNLHTGRRPYTCPFCQRTFANGSNCRSHKRRMHPEELKMYEAALAAGQQPVILHEGGNRNVDDDDDNSEESKLSRKDSGGEEKTKREEGEGVEGLGGREGSLGPLNLQRDEKRIKEEEDEEEDDGGLVEGVTFNGGENLGQMGFGSHAQSVEYPYQNMYSFQSTGIPAFPGNPFFRQ